MEFINDTQENIDKCLNCKKSEKACESCSSEKKTYKMCRLTPLQKKRFKKIEEMHAKGAIDREIAKKLRVSQATVCKMRQVMGLKANGADLWLIG